MKIIQKYDGYTKRGDETWTDTVFDTEVNSVELVSRVYKGRYRLVEVLRQSDYTPAGRPEMHEAAKGDEASTAHHEAAA